MGSEPKRGIISGYDWRWPAASRKAHIFPANDLRSLCMKWAMGGVGTPVRIESEHDRPGPEDCAECHRRLKKHLAPTKGKHGRK